MAKSEAETVEDYLAELAPERREAIEAESVEAHRRTREQMG